MALTAENDVSSALNSALLELLPAALERMDLGLWRRFFAIRPDGRSSVVLNGVNTTGRFQEQPIGQKTPEGMVFEGAPLTITASRFSEKKVFDGKTVAEVEAAKNGSLQETVLNWAAQSERTNDLRATDFLRSSSNGYDGVPLYSASHPQMSKTGAGDTFSNDLSTATAVSDNMVKTLLARFEETNAVGENGEKITWKATDIVATTHSDLYELTTVLKSIGRAGTANNDINALAMVNNGLQVNEWRELTPTSGTTRYVHVFNNRAGENGLKYIEQSALMTNAWYDPDAEQYFYKASQSGGFGCINWRCTARQKTVA